MAGCWTCRVRKKKCGQQKPTCDDCRRLGLRCDGYGQRPDWADGGTKQYEYKTQLKVFVKRRHRSKRTRSLPEPIPTPPSFHDSQEGADDLGPACNLHDYFHEPLEMTTHFSEKQEDVRFSPIDMAMPPSNEFNQSMTQMEMITLQNTNSYDCNSMRSSAEPTLQGSVSEIHCVPYSIDEFQLLSYYLDHVFWTQYPHLDQSAVTNDRTWILAFFQSSREFQKALIHLTRYLQNSANHNPTAGSEMDDTASTRIIQMLYERIKAPLFKGWSHSRESIVPLISASALMAYYGTVTGQRDCVHSSLSVAHVLLEHIRQLDCDSWEPRYDARIDSSTHNHLCLAMKLSVAQLLWIDTFEAATTSSSCILHLHSLAEKLGLSHELESLFGCRMWTLQTVREAVDLALWKRTSLMSGRLSVRELVSRSEALLDKRKEFQGSMSPNFDNSSMPMTTWPISDLPPSMSLQNPWTLSNFLSDGDIAILTRIYTQAIAVYVHVVVSGANSSLLEIRSCISSALDLVSQLRSVDMLACMFWPLMIFSCLSAHSQRDRCKGILDRAAHRPKLRRACVRISNLAQKCWQLDGQTPTMPWDWERVFHSGLLHL